MEYHEICLKFPESSPEVKLALESSMRLWGYDDRDPIWLYEGKILDGRTRYDAATAVGVKPEFGDFTGSRAEALQFAIRKNAGRRDLSRGQRAICAAREVTTKVGDNQYQQSGCEDPHSHISREQAAEMFAIHVSDVSRAQTIIGIGVPELEREVWTGKISLEKAHSKAVGVKRQREAERAAEDRLKQAELAAEQAVESGDVAAQEAALADERAAESDREQAAERAERQRDFIAQGVEGFIAGDKSSFNSAYKEARRKELRDNPLPLPDGKYRTIVIDPPWPIQVMQTQENPNHVDMDYPVMSVREIGELDIPSLLNDWDPPKEDMTHDENANGAFVFLWTTQTFLPDAIRLLDGWGLSYAFTMVWNKNGGMVPFNKPQYNVEFVVVGRKGNPDFLELTDFKAGFYARRDGDSEKPEAFYKTLARVTQEPRLDMFNRRRIGGFETWGDENETSAQREVQSAAEDG